MNVLLHEAVEEDGQRREADVVQSQVGRIVQRLLRAETAVSLCFRSFFDWFDRSVSTHLLGEATEELVEELGEDEDNVLWRETRKTFDSLQPAGNANVQTQQCGRCAGGAQAGGGGHLVEEVLHELGDSYVVIVSVDEQHLLEVFELGDGVVAVPNCLTTLLTHDA